MIEKANLFNYITLLENHQKLSIIELLLDLMENKLLFSTLL